MSQFFGKYIFKSVIAIVGISLVLLIAILLFSNNHILQDRKYLWAVSIYNGDENTGQNPDKAIRIWTDLGYAGHTPSQCVLAYLYGQDRKGHFDDDVPIIQQDIDKVIFWLDQTGEKCPVATYQLARFYMSSPEYQNEEEAIRLLSPVANWGYDSAQYYLAELFKRTDKLQAKNWYLRAAKQGHIDALQTLKTLDPNIDAAAFSTPSYEQPDSKKDLDWIDVLPEFMILFILHSFIET